MKELICIVCPKGCHLTVDEKNDFKVTGGGCARGEEYGRTELQNPTRVLTSTVRVTGAELRRCPVKTRGTIPKGLIFDAMRLLDKIWLTSPVKEGTVVVENICGTGIPFVVTRDM